MTNNYKYRLSKQPKFIIAMIIHTVKGINVNSNQIYKYNNNGNKASRIDHTYDRIILCADLNSRNGKLFALVFNSHTNSIKSLALHRHEAFSKSPFQDNGLQLLIQFSKIIICLQTKTLQFWKSRTLKYYHILFQL